MHRWMDQVGTALVAGALGFAAWGDGPADDGEAVARSQWFQDARFGMFIHWGPPSILAGQWEGRWMPGEGRAASWYSEWVQMRLSVPDEAYQRVARSFNPTAFDADAWAREAEGAGMRYVVLVAKHHDGFALWDSAVSDYDLGATAFGRDLIGELVEACRARGLKVGFYYSHWQDWHHAGGAMPPWEEMADRQPSDAEFEAYWRGVSLPQVRELIDWYDPDLMWFDTWGDEARREITPARRDELIALIRERSPRCLINGRIANHDPGDEVDYLSAHDNEFLAASPGRPWQTPGTMRRSWAWHARDYQWKTSAQMLERLSHNASLGGNYLLNVGPLPDGTLAAPAVRRLREMGGWMAVHGEAIRGASPVEGVTVPAGCVMTQRARVGGGTRWYVHVHEWPADGRVALPVGLPAGVVVTLLETGEPLAVEAGAVALPESARGQAVPVLALDG